MEDSYRSNSVWNELHRFIRTNSIPFKHKKLQGRHFDFSSGLLSAMVHKFCGNFQFVQLSVLQYTSDPTFGQSGLHHLHTNESGILGVIWDTWRYRCNFKKFFDYHFVKGICGICYQVCDVPSSLQYYQIFSLSSGTFTAQTDSQCTTDWIQIPCATDQQSSSTTLSNGLTCVNKICGNTFNVNSGSTISAPVYSNNLVIT